MDVQRQIDEYIASQPGPKQSEMQLLHDSIRRIRPDARLWFLDGTDESGKVVSNPNIGYGDYAMKLAGGKTRDFYRIGLSGNKSGISVYVLGVEDKKYLAAAFGERLGKATVTGYCIKFKTLKDIDLSVLEEAVRFGFGLSDE